MNRADENYQKAAEIADQLLARGVPVVNFTTVAGAYIAIGFQLENDRCHYTAKLPVQDATAERFRELYEAVA